MLHDLDPLYRLVGHRNRGLLPVSYEGKCARYDLEPHPIQFPVMQPHGLSLKLGFLPGRR